MVPQVRLEHDIRDWQEIGRRPIPGEAPAGEPIRSEPCFEYLQTELQKLDSLSAQQIDWHQVVAEAEKILNQRSKDLLVGCYLCLALFEEDGYSGLLAGISCLETMVSIFWEALHPPAKQTRARLRCFEWLAEQLGRAVRRRPPQPSDQNAAIACAKKLRALDKTLEDKADTIPGLGSILKTFDEFQGQSASVSHATPSGAISPKPVTQASAAPVTGEPIQLLRQAEVLVDKAVSAAREQNPSAAWIYRASRVMVWLEIDDYPPNDAGKSRIPAPAANTRDSFENLIERAAWADLLSRAETQIHEQPFWLDLQRYSATALQRLGPSYDHARYAVITECQTLLRRLPDLIRFEFTHGFPFADSQTRSWVANELFPENDAPDEKAGVSQEITEELLEKRQRFLALMNDGKLDDAVELFRQELAGVSSASRAEFLTRFELAKLCLKSGHFKPAMLQFTLLNQSIEGHSLELWEPELARDVLQAWWKALLQHARQDRSSSVETLRQAEEIQQRLTRLDIRYAFGNGNSKLRKRKALWHGTNQ